MMRLRFSFPDQNRRSRCSGWKKQNAVHQLMQAAGFFESRNMHVAPGRITSLMQSLRKTHSKITAILDEIRHIMETTWGEMQLTRIPWKVGVEILGKRHL